MMPPHASVDEPLVHLHAAGWLIGAAAVLDLNGSEWLTTGSRATFTVTAQGKTQAAAWARACRLDWSCGLRTG
jgi:hypothetical protein